MELERFSMMTMKEVMVIDGIPLYTWQEHMIRCPSQADYHFYSGGSYYTIYLRWRHTDPWTANLIKTGDSPDDSDTYQTNEWFPIELGREYKENEFEDLKRDVVKIVSAQYRFQSPYKRST